MFLLAFLLAGSNCVLAAVRIDPTLNYTVTRKYYLYDLKVSMS